MYQYDTWERLDANPTGAATRAVTNPADRSVVGLGNTGGDRLIARGPSTPPPVAGLNLLDPDLLDPDLLDPDLLDPDLLDPDL